MSTENKSLASERENALLHGGLRGRMAGAFCTLQSSVDALQRYLANSATPDVYDTARAMLEEMTDRIAALKNELVKLGYPIADRNDSVLEWDGRHTAPQSTPAIDTYDDHRMALAFAPAAVRFPGLVVNHPEVVSKSYPDFWDDLKQNGFTVNEI